MHTVRFNSYYTWVGPWIDRALWRLFFVTRIHWAFIFPLYFQRNSTFNKYKISKTIPRKLSKPFHHIHWLYKMWHRSSCKLVCDYEVKCTHCVVWREFLHFTVKNKFHKKMKWNLSKVTNCEILFLASRSHFLFLLRFFPKCLHIILWFGTNSVPNVWEILLSHILYSY